MRLCMKAKTKFGISQLVQQIGTTKFLVCIVRLYYQNHQYLNQIDKSRFNQSIVNSLLEYFRRKISDKYKTKASIFFKAAEPTIPTTHIKYGLHEVQKLKIYKIIMKSRVRY